MWMSLNFNVFGLSGCQILVYRLSSLYDGLLYIGDTTLAWTVRGTDSSKLSWQHLVNINYRMKTEVNFAKRSRSVICSLMPLGFISLIYLKKKR